MATTNRTIGRTLYACQLLRRPQSLFHRGYAAGGRQTRGQAPDSSRKPVDAGVNAAQNPHLKHAPSSTKGGKKEGKGNAAENPELPSHREGSEGTSAWGDPPVDWNWKARKFHTSATAYNNNNAHTADTYAKDVDNSPATDGTTHTVSSDAQVSNKSIPKPVSQQDKNPSQGGGRPQKENVDTYKNVSGEEPYQPRAKEEGVDGEKGDNLRYGGVPKGGES